MIFGTLYDNNIIVKTREILNLLNKFFFDICDIINVCRRCKKVYETLISLHLIQKNWQTNLHNLL